MPDITLVAAQKILATCLELAGDRKLKPIAIALLDARGALKVAAAQDGTSLKRAEVALGKASGAIALGVGSRTLFKRARDQPFFIAAVGAMMEQGLVPVPGGVLIRTPENALLGAVGISGDSSDNDEALACAAISAAGLVADPGID